MNKNFKNIPEMFQPYIENYVVKFEINVCIFKQKNKGFMKQNPSKFA